MKNIYKYKKNTMSSIMLIFPLITLIELIKYFFVDSNIFGLIYMIINFIILFLFIPTAYNYNKYYSAQRISKLVIVIILGIFSSYILGPLTLKVLSYKDYSKDFMSSIFVTKNILKGLIYLILIVITSLEFKLDKVLQTNKSIKDGKKDIKHKKVIKKKKIIKKVKRVK